MEYRVNLEVNINADKGDNSDFINSKVSNNSDRDRVSSDALKEVSNRRASSSSDSEKNSSNKAGKAALKTMAVSLVKNTSMNVANAVYDSTVQQYMYNGNTARANQLNNTKAKVTGPVGLVSSALSGAAMGSALGPYGAVIGATVSVAIDAVQMALDYNNKTMEFFYKFQDMNMQAEKTARRMGIQGSKRNREGSYIYKL